jgi:hypothetical protein
MMACGLAVFSRVLGRPAGRVERHRRFSPSGAMHVFARYL